MPQVTVIIPTCNRKQMLLQAIESVRKQTFKDWQLIIVDDGSEDGTKEVVEKICSKEVRIQYLYDGDNKGANARRNQGAKVARGKYIIYLDSDDLLALDCLQTRTEGMESYPDLDFMVYLIKVFNHKPEDLQFLWNVHRNRDDIERFLDMDVPWGIHAVIWKREALIKLGYLDEDLLRFQDWDIGIRALIGRMKYKKINKIDCYYRIGHGDSLGGQWDNQNHFQSQEKLFLKIQNMLMLSYPENEMYKSLLAKFYLELMNHWFNHRNYQRGLRIWLTAKKSRMISFFQFWAGIMYVIVQKLPRGKYFLRRHLEKKWPSLFGQRKNKTFMKHGNIGAFLKNEI